MEANVTLEEALKEAHQQICTVVDAAWPDKHLQNDLCVESHVAIALVAKVAALEQAEKMVTLMVDLTGSCPVTLVEERDRLRREAEEVKRD